MDGGTGYGISARTLRMVFSVVARPEFDELIDAVGTLSP